MHRREFFKRLFAATTGATIAYSFPSIIVPKNLEVIAAINNERLPIDLITKHEIYPKLIHDFWFTETPLGSYLRSNMKPLEKEEINPLRRELGFRFNERMVFRG